MNIISIHSYTEQITRGTPGLVMNNPSLLFGVALLSLSNAVVVRADSRACEPIVADAAIKQAYSDMSDLGVDVTELRVDSVKLRGESAYFVGLSSGLLYMVAVKSMAQSCQAVVAQRFAADRAIDLRVAFSDLDIGPSQDRSFEIFLPSDGESPAAKAPSVRFSLAGTAQVVSSEVWLEGARTGWRVLIDLAPGSLGFTAKITRADGSHVRVRVGR